MLMSAALTFAGKRGGTPLSSASTNFSTDVDCSDTFRTFGRCRCIRLGIVNSALGIEVGNRRRLRHCEE